MQSYKSYFWRWEDHTEVLAIPNGSTIVYRDFVLQALEHLSEQGLPPFGALLLATIATNHSMGEDLKQVEEAMTSAIHDAIHSSPQNHVDYVPLKDALVFLKILAQLPPAYTQGNKRLQLFQVLFENCHNLVSNVKAKKLAGSIKHTLAHHKGSFIDVLERQETFIIGTYKKDFRCIGLLIKKFPDTESIIASMAAVVPLPEVEIELPEQAATGKSSEEFLDELTSNSKTFQIGSLVKHIWSGLNIQLHNLLPSEQPLGGVSDLANKGNFDKLLISEFANDDLVFLSRLANNEALYLHRETPPTTDKLERVLLLDVSLKSWGTPKLLAFSALIAIAKHPKTDIACTAFAVSDTYQRLHFDTVDEVIESVNKVEGVLNPAKGLAQFFQEYNSGKKTEVLFISSPDTLKHPEVQKVISDFQSGFKYWITTSQEGTLEFYKNQHNSKKLVHKMHLPLEELWKRPVVASTQPVINEGHHAAVPLLFPYTANYKKFLSSGDDYFLVTPEKKLLYFYGLNSTPAQKGLELWLENLPSGVSSYEIGPDENGDYIFLCFKNNTREITLHNLTTNEKEVLYFNDWQSSTFPEFFFYQGAFYYVTISHYWKIEQFPKWQLVKHTNSGMELNQAYTDRQEQLKKAVNAFQPISLSVLKNLSEVYINQNRNLVFNKHALQLNDHGIIQLKTTAESNREAIIEAQPTTTDNEFVFPNGCTVTLNRSGVFILTSSESEEEELYDVILQTAGSNKENLVRAIQARTNLRQRYAKDIVEFAPRIIKSKISKTEADVLSMDIGEFGGVAEVVVAQKGNVAYIPSVIDGALGVATQHYFAGSSYYNPDRTSELQLINSKTFYETYIKGFISQVVDHGN